MQLVLGELYVVPGQSDDLTAFQAGVSTKEDQAAFLGIAGVGRQLKEFIGGVVLPLFSRLGLQAGVVRPRSGS